MNGLTTIALAFLLLSGSAMAFSADFSFNLEEAINSFLVSWTGNYTSDLSGEEGEVFYLKGSNSFSSCNASASLWDSNISSGSLNFSLTQLNESGMDLKIEIDGTDYDLNVSENNYSLPIMGLNQRVCLKAIGTNNGAVQISTTDFNVMEA